MRYWLIFCDSDARHLRWYKKGYRHMWIAATLHGVWVTVDPLACSIDIDVHMMSGLAPVQVFKFWETKGYKYLEVKAGRCPAMPLIPEAMTCVGVAKRFLGLNKPFIQTPFQLFQFLTKNQT